MNVANTHQSKLSLQPQGAYVELTQLQQLRYLAESFSTSRQIARSNSASGHHRSRALSRGMEFEEVRQYQPGDDVRNIDWRVTARTQITHTKRYQDEKEKPVITLVDQRRSLFFGSRHCFKSVYACHVAALINWSTLKRGDRAGGVVISSTDIQETRPKRSHQAVNRWLKMLSQANQALDIYNNTTNKNSEPSFKESLKQLLRVARTGTDCVLITDGYDLNDDCEEVLFQLSRHNNIILYWLFDPMESALPSLPIITVSDGDNKSTLSINKNQQIHFHQRFIEKQTYIQQLCRKFSIQLNEVAIDKPLSETINLNSKR
jgi:uncharacterized protein (DUF58 family)